MADDDKKPVDHGDALNRFQRTQGNERQRPSSLLKLCKATGLPKTARKDC